MNDYDKMKQATKEFINDNIPLPNDLKTINNFRNAFQHGYLRGWKARDKKEGEKREKKEKNEK